MIRLGKFKFALTLLLLLPTAAAAQKDSKFTREATKFLGLAMANSDPAAREANYRQALTHLQQGQQEDAENAKVWLLSGQVLAGLGQMAEADAAFRKAVEMHPEYAEEISAEREAAWVDAFNRGVQAMDEQRYPDAIKAMEDAQLIYNQRPEALMNLGALYANAGDNAKAQQAFADAVVATRSPLFDKLDEAQQADWLRFRTLATVNLAQMHGASGVEAFQASNYDAALAAFKQAAELNPHSRDYWFNQVQSLWAQTSAMERDKTEAEKLAMRTQLVPLYEQVEQLAKKTREFDPASEVLFIIEAQSYKARGELNPDSAAKKARQQQTLEVLTHIENAPVFVDEVAVMEEGAQTVVRGMLKNNNVAAGAPITIQFTLVDLAGNVVGEQSATVNAPAKDESAEFQVPVATTGSMAGWKYVIK